ncbi:permease-like cell division protein FtsX [Granulicatella seriolae]|uniref:Cell division protein FtsX n=1 Tax=Granulicatella seriolae TaxID=2967226 RepID=A0ABT1WQE3_9LACT|nr:permease-like cell division protein FtsX [Granulicatella seriolae]
MKIRTFSRHIRDAFKSLFRNGLMSFGAISAVSMTLVLVGFFIAILFNVNQIATEIENDVNVRVYIDLAADQAKQDELKTTIEGLDNVASVTFRSRDQELDDITKSFAQEFELFKDDGNPLYDTFEVSTTSPDTTKPVAEAIEKITYVAKVNYGGAQADKLFATIGTIRNIGIVIIAGLLLIAVFLISNTIRSTIYARRTEIEIMKLVGAKDSYIRWPFFLEGGIIGLLGSIVPIILLWLVYLSVYGNASNFLATSSLTLLNPNPFLIQLSLILAAIGIVIGSFGSMFSVRRFLKI